MVETKGRVVRIVSDLPFGGVERRLLSLIPRLKRLGWDVSVVCIREAGQMAPIFEREGIRIQVLPFKSRWSPQSLFQLARRLKQERVDIVHTHMYRCNTSGTVAARLAGVKVVIANVHNVNEWDDFGQLFTEKRLARFKDIVVAVSERVRQNYIKRTGVSPDKVVTLYNGVDLEPFQRGTFDAGVAQQLGLNRGERIVAMIARLVEQKRHVDFLTMAAQVLKKVEAVRFLVVGKGKLQAQLEQKAVELGIAHRVVFTGHRDDIPALFSLTDVCVICSEREGFSNALLESMAAGVPVVATDAGGNAEAIVDGQSGFVVPARRPDLLADRVTTLLTSRELHRTFSENARERAKTFSIERMCEATDRLYLELLSKSRRLKRAGG